MCQLAGIHVFCVLCQRPGWLVGGNGDDAYSTMFMLGPYSGILGRDSITTALLWHVLGQIIQPIPIEVVKKYYMPGNGLCPPVHSSLLV